MQTYDLKSDPKATVVLFTQDASVSLAQITGGFTAFTHNVSLMKHMDNNMLALNDR